MIAIRAVRHTSCVVRIRVGSPPDRTPPKKRFDTAIRTASQATSSRGGDSCHSSVNVWRVAARPPRRPCKFESPSPTHVRHGGRRMRPCVGGNTAEYGHFLGFPASAEVQPMWFAFAAVLVRRIDRSSPRTRVFGKDGKIGQHALTGSSGPLPCAARRTEGFLASAAL